LTPEGIRDVLVVVLTLATGATDAIGFIRLGGVFTSVMTGNMVLLGVSGGNRDGALALHAGVAFVGYIVGSWLGARMAGHAVTPQPVWPRRITTALVVELALFTVFGVWWEVAGGHPSGRATYALIAINAVALGVQSGAVIRFGVGGLSTTYLTGTLTHVVASFTRRELPVSIRSVAILAGLVGGAGLGAVLTIEVPRAAPAAPLGVLVVVLAGATAAFRSSWSRPPDQDSAPGSDNERG
jgi:uncharacterized membrane protein YoaK (UPF0700 family)